MVKRNGRELVPIQRGTPDLAAPPGELALVASVLQRIDVAMACIEQATDPTDVKNFRAVLVGLQELSEQLNHNSQVRYRLAEAKLLAERKIGVMLSQLKIVGGRHKAPALKEMNISWRQSREWQTLAKLSEDEVRQFVAATQATARNPSTSSALRFARQITPPGKAAPAKPRTGKKGKVGISKASAGTNSFDHNTYEEGFDAVSESYQQAKQALELARQLPNTLDARFCRLLPRLLSDIVSNLSEFLCQRAAARNATTDTRSLSN